jgi:hypothetical protein
MASGHEGGCLCGAVRYQVAPHRGNGYHCHCTACQKMTGASYLVEHCFAPEAFELLAGTPKVHAHVSGGSGKQVYIHFCANCGTKLYLTFERWTETLNIFSGTLDDPAVLDFSPETIRQIFVDRAPGGTLIPPGYETFSGHCDPADGSIALPVVFDETRLMGGSVSGDVGLHVGGCLCGDVRYKVRGGPSRIVICHCEYCRKALGGAPNAQCLFPPQALTVTNGSPATYANSSTSGCQMVKLNFCARCGGGLWLDSQSFAEVAVFRGTLDRPDWIMLARENTTQIFSDSAMPSSMIIAGVPTYRGASVMPDGRSADATIFEDHRLAGAAR